MRGFLPLAALFVPSALVGQAGPWPWDLDSPWHIAVEWENVAPDGPTALAVMQAAAAELAIGRPDRALALIANLAPEGVMAGPLLALRAAATDATGADTTAAHLYAAAASRTVGEARGVLLARAGAAYARGGLADLAERHYRQAVSDLPAAAGWLRLRAAAVARDPAAVESLLTGVPTAGVVLGQAARARAWLTAGDTAAAIQNFNGAGAFPRAAELALASGDSAVARTLAYRGLAQPDPLIRRPALDLVERVFPPGDVGELMMVARAWSAEGDTRKAVRYGRAAVARGDESEATANTLGQWLEGVGERRAALAVYAAGGADGAYRRARALLRLGRRSEAARALIAFANGHPEHRWAPLSLYLAADVRGGDSLFHAVIGHWPAHAYASRARFRIAARALRRADTSAVLQLYQSEVAARGEDARLARYMMARLHQARGEDDLARTVFAALARDDSVGYYGTIARSAAGLPAPVFAPPPSRTPTPAVQQALQELDLLEITGFREEADLLAADLMDREWVDADELLDLADGFIVRGRGPQGVRLGWRASRTLSLNHPRVIRTVFPWPNRAMIEREAEKFGLDPHLLAGLIRQESSFEPAARSRAGARGFMQLMPATARGVANRLQVPWNETMFGVADANVHVGAAHLSGLLRWLDGNLVAALAAYNAGGTPVRRWLRYPEAADPAYFVERIPYVETRGYVRTVLRNHALYRALYP